MSARRRAAPLLLLALLGLGGGAPALAKSDPGRLYVLGRRAVKDGYPRQAVLRLTAAIAERTNEGEPWVGVYGENREPYLAHFYLGLAFFDLGEHDLALRAWEESERQGAVKEFPEYRVLLEKRGLIEREILPQSAEGVRAGLATLRAAVAEGRTALDALQAVGDDPGELALRLGRVDDELAAQSALLAAEGGKSFRVLREVEERAATALLEAAAVRREAGMRAAALGGERIDAAVKAALAVLGDSGCRRDGLARLVSLERLAAARAEAASAARAARLELGVARAALACGELERAAQSLAAAAHGGGADPPEFLRLRAELGVARERLMRDEREDLAVRDDALARFAEAAAAADAGECDRPVIARLEAASETVRRHARRRELVTWIALEAGVPYAPQFQLARAYRSCGDPERAAAALEKSRGRAEELPADMKAEADGLEGWVRREKVRRFYGESHALVLLARDYESKDWPDLPRATLRSEQIEATLRKLGFAAPKIIANPTLSQLRGAVADFIAAFGGPTQPRNRLLIYFAGHGMTIHGTYGGSLFPVGFLVPTDAPPPPATVEDNEKFEKRAISMDQVHAWAKQIASAHHAVFVFDSCFAGSVFQVMPSGLISPPSILDQQVGDPARYFITASNEEDEVPDSTAFIDTLLAALDGREGKEVLYKDRILFGDELCVYLRHRDPPIHPASKPLCGPMPPPYNRGDIFFVLPPLDGDAGAHEAPSEAARAAARQELEAWRGAAAAGSAVAYRIYLESYPHGRFAGLVRSRLGLTMEGREH